MNQAFHELVQKLHRGANPFDGHNPEHWPVNQHSSWGSHHPWFRRFITELRPRLIIEVGSFLGGSAIHMGKILKELGLHDSAVCCVDTWLAEEILWSLDEIRPLLNFRHAVPHFYQTFLSNVMAEGLQDAIVPIRMPSFPAARYLHHCGLQAQFIYIDGSHIEGEVIRDLALYWPLLAHGGVMMVDDYSPLEGRFKGLVADVNRFAKLVGLPLEVVDLEAALRKP